jgi:hypothetical protein
MKKYELTTDFIEINETKLYRIKALKDFSYVREGDLGGFIEKESNLAQENDSWIYDNAMVSGNASVYDNARVSGNAMVYGNARVFGDSKVAFIPIHLIGLKWTTTITDNNIHIGCKTFTLNKALVLASRWKSTLEKFDEAYTIEKEKQLIVAAIKLRLSQLELLNKKENK